MLAAKVQLWIDPELDFPQRAEEVDWDQDEDNRLQVTRMLADLEEEERELIRLRFWKGMTLKQVGALLGLTRQAIQLRERKVVNKLRKMCSVSTLPLEIPVFIKNRRTKNVVC